MTLAGEGVIANDVLKMRKVIEFCVLLQPICADEVSVVIDKSLISSL